MKSKLPKYKRLIFMAIIVVALGVTLSTTMADRVGHLGTVMIAIGGLLLIAGMSLKRKRDEQKNDQ